MHRLILMLIALMVLAPFVARAQEDLRVPVVQTTGKATVYAPPSAVSFWLHRTAREETMEASMTRAQALEEELRAALNENEVAPLLVEAMPPAVLHLTENVVSASVHLQFSMTPYGNTKSGPMQFAKLCGAIGAIAKTLGCEAQGPLLEVGDEAALVKAASIQATENAYLPASGVAEVLKSSVYSVDSVQVDEVQWNAPLRSEAVEPNLRQVSCTVTVRVTYSLSTKS